jgi:hypothetical protein
MQARILLPAAAPVPPVAAALDDAVDADDEVLDDEGALDELLPHAAISRLAAAAAAAVINPVFLTVFLPWTWCASAQAWRAASQPRLAED